MKTAYSPLRIEILLHYYVRTEPLNNIDAPAVKEAIGDLVAEEVLVCLYETTGHIKYAITPLGKAWLQALCNVPIPRQVFVDEQGRIL